MMKIIYIKYQSFRALRFARVGSFGSLNGCLLSPFFWGYFLWSLIFLIWCWSIILLWIKSSSFSGLSIAVPAFLLSVICRYLLTANSGVWMLLYNLPDTWSDLFRNFIVLDLPKKFSGNLSCRMTGFRGENC